MGVISRIFSSSTRIPIFPSNDPGDNSYYKDNNSGGDDAFIARIDPLYGQVIWSAYFGGAGNDIAKSITIDRIGEVFITGNTNSTSANNNNCKANTTTAFPLCGPANSYYQSSNKGNVDIFIASFNSNNFLTWSTFYGSPEMEWVSEMAYSGASENIYLVGRTNKNSDTNPSPQSYDGLPRTDGNFPLCDMAGSNDFFQPSIGGFVSSFNANNKSENWATNIKNIDDVHSVASSPSNYIYISAMGIGTGISSCSPVSNNYIPICNINGGYSYDGNDPLRFSDMFIAKFNTTTNELSWSTMYPGDVAIISSSGYLATAPNKVYRKIVDINVDVAGNVYIIGTNTGNPDGLFWPYNCSGMYNKGQIYAGDYNNLADVFILGFSNTNDILWATYFGADAGVGTDWTTHPAYVDISAAISTYKTNSLYITGYTGSGGPSGAPGAFPLVDLGGGAYYHEADPYYQWQVFISKFDLYAAGYGVEDIADENSLLNIYPNPSIDNNIFVDFPLTEKGTFQIFNTIGDVIYQCKISNSNTIAINVESFSKGCYLIRVTEKDNVMIGKYIKF